MDLGSLTSQVERPEFNTRTEYTIVPHVPPGHPKAGIPRPFEGSSGEYVTTFIFCVPGRDVFRENLDFPQIMKSGDSLLYIGSSNNLKIEPSDKNEASS